MMNSSGVVPSSSPPSSSSSFGRKSLHPPIRSSTNYYFRQLPHPHISLSSRPRLPRLCCSSSSPGSPGSGESDNKTVLDAFFLGKALGEALTERIESAVGEVLSTIGRLQAEQQKQVQEFQEDVLERAKRAKEKAAREALQEQGRLISSFTKDNPQVTNGGSSSPSPPSDGPITLAPPTSVEIENSPPSGIDEDGTDQGYISRIQIDE